MLSAVKSVNSIAVQTCKKDKQSSLADFNISLFDFILLSFTCRLQNRNIDYLLFFTSDRLMFHNRTCVLDPSNSKHQKIFLYLKYLHLWYINKKIWHYLEMLVYPWLIMS